MSNSFVEIAPNNGIHDGVIARTDMVGLFPYPFNGYAKNTGPRLQEIVNRSGLTIVAGEFFGQDDDNLFGVPVREALQYGQPYADTSKKQAEGVLKVLEKYGPVKRIGIGHSLGSVAVSGMQLHGEEPPFDCIELADGFNLRDEGQPSVAGFLGYNALDVGQQLVHRLCGIDTTGGTNLPAYDWSGSAKPQVKSYFEKIRDLKDLMRSSVGYTSAIDLAGKVELPLHMIGYTRGLSGSRRELLDFMDAQKITRAIAARISSRKSAPAPLETTIRKGWHSALLNPNIAETLRKTMDMAVR